MVFEHFFDFFRFLCKITCFLLFCRFFSLKFVQNSLKMLTFSQFEIINENYLFRKSLVTFFPLPLFAKVEKNFHSAIAKVVFLCYNS